MDRTIHIVCNEITKKNGELCGGGVVNYINNLASQLTQHGFKVYVHETSLLESSISDARGYTDIRYQWKRKGAKAFSKVGNKERMRLIYESGLYNDNDIIIVSTDYLAKGLKVSNSICIQHGIAWDVPFSKNPLLHIARITPLFLQKMLLISGIDRVVCVDYNYLNWFRGNFAYQKVIDKFEVIPNFTSIPNYKPNNGIIYAEKLKIVFARRLVVARGTRVMTEAILALSSREYFENLVFYIAGVGPEIHNMKKTLGSFRNVIFENYPNGQGMEYHLDKDIAVVPTFGSEGTSLSALEALAAGCALITTYVGGLSNIVLSGHNGLVIKPNSIELANCIERLYRDRNLTYRLQRNGYSTAVEAFSEDMWINRWLSLIQSFNG